MLTSIRLEVEAKEQQQWSGVATSSVRLVGRQRGGGAALSQTATGSGSGEWPAKPSRVQQWARVDERMRADEWRLRCRQWRCSGIGRVAAGWLTEWLAGRLLCDWLIDSEVGDDPSGVKDRYSSSSNSSRIRLSNQRQSRSIMLQIDMIMNSRTKPLGPICWTALDDDGAAT